MLIDTNSGYGQFRSIGRALNVSGEYVRQVNRQAYELKLLDKVTVPPGSELGESPVESGACRTGPGGCLRE